MVKRKSIAVIIVKEKENTMISSLGILRIFTQGPALRTLAFLPVILILGILGALLLGLANFQEKYEKR